MSEKAASIYRDPNKFIKSIDEKLAEILKYKQMTGYKPSSHKGGRRVTKRRVVRRRKTQRRRRC